MTKALCFLLSFQCPLVHLLGLSHLALTLIEIAQVVDGVECGCMLRTPCFLVSLQSALVHLLRLSHLTLISIENAQVVESILSVLVLGCTRSVDGDELLYISICMRE